MDKIITPEKATEISKQLREKGGKIVLAGGCFDILHIGHIRFLREAKKLGDFLFVLLESDKSIKSFKGKNRPINSQEDRADILSSLFYIDYVIMLPQLGRDRDYDRLIFEIKPDIIAATKGDPNIRHKERQAKMLNAKVINVIDNISNKSTSNLIKLLGEDYL